MSNGVWIIAEQRENGAAVALYASEIEAIRQLRTAQVLQTTDQAIGELDALHEHFCDLRDAGHEWVDTKFVEKSGDKNEQSIERIPIHEAICRTLEMKLKRYKQESELLEPYAGIRATKPYEKGGHMRITIEADAEFAAEWRRVTQMESKPIDVEVVEVEEDE